MVAPGTIVGPYEVLSPLGAGGMGEVYRARDTRLDRLIALKLLPADVARDPERLARFEREARAASALNHPAIVTIYDIGAADVPWISMELVEGDTLRGLLASGPLPLRRALGLAAQLADGLAKAHDAGIVHRDLKPDNVMVTGDGFAKILDFGLARLTATPAEADAATRPGADTRPGMVMGTLAYMSPEQAGGAVVDFRSDQFSFGAVLYEMLTGARAFERSSSVDTLSAILRDDPRPIGELNVTIPPPVRWIVERCVEKRAADRYGSTRDLARDLANARDHLPELSPALPVAAVSDRRTGARTNWREAVAWALAIVLPIATAGVLLRRGSRDVPQRPSALRFTLPAPENGAIERGKFAVSPDGRRIVLVVTDGDRTTRLWVRAFDSLTWQRLPGTEGGADPFWSPDGATIGFFTSDKLKRVPATGGEVRIICDVSEDVGGAWGADDTIVFGQQSTLLRVAATGGTPSKVTALATGTDDVDFWPIFLPDGRTFLFYRLSGERTGIYLATLDAAAPVFLKPLATRVTFLGFSQPNFVLFVENGTLIAQSLNADRNGMTGEVIHIAENVYTDAPWTSFSASASGLLVYWTGRQDITELKWFRRDGTPGGGVIGRGAFTSFSLSRSGRYLAVGRDDTAPASVWTYDLERSSSRRLTSDDYAQIPVWSPDAARVAFGSARGSPPNLYLTTVGGGQQSERLTRSTLVEFPADWSSDGEHLLFTRIDPKTGFDVWTLPMSGERVPRPVLNSRFAEPEAAVSPDGRRLAYTSDETGRLQVYVTTFPTAGEHWPVSTTGGLSPAWSADGRELFYRDKQRIMAVAIKSRAGFEAGAPKVLFEVEGLPRETEQHPFEVAPDGRFLVNVVVERSSLPLTVVSDWRAGLVK